MSLLKYFVAIFLLISIGSCSTDANKPENVIPEMEVPEEGDDTNEEEEEAENVFEGDIVLTNQDEIDDFGSNNYTLVTGNVSIIYDENNPSGPEITSLLPLISIETISNDLLIQTLNDLENLDGLENIVNIFGNVSLVGSSSLLNINGISTANFNKLLFLQSLSALETFPEFNQITSLEILRVQSLSIQELNSLNNLTEISLEISIGSNNMLETISGFQTLETVGGNFNLSGHDSLQTVNGFTSLSTIDGDISIVGNLMPNIDFLQNIQTGRSIYIGGSTSNEILNISGLQSLVSCKFLTLENINSTSIESLQSFSEVESIRITNCPNLTSLNGLENLGPNLSQPSTIATFMQNENLTDFCAITNLVVSSPNITFTTIFNGFDPTEQDILSGNCSM